MTYEIYGIYRNDSIDGRRVSGKVAVALEKNRFPGADQIWEKYDEKCMRFGLKFEGKVNWKNVDAVRKFCVDPEMLVVLTER